MDQPPSPTPPTADDVRRERRERLRAQLSVSRSYSTTSSSESQPEQCDVFPTDTLQDSTPPTTFHSSGQEEIGTAEKEGGVSLYPEDSILKKGVALPTSIGIPSESKALYSEFVTASTTASCSPNKALFSKSTASFLEGCEGTALPVDNSDLFPQDAMSGVNVARVQNDASGAPKEENFGAKVETQETSRVPKQETTIAKVETQEDPKFDGTQQSAQFTEFASSSDSFDDIESQKNNITIDETDSDESIQQNRRRRSLWIAPAICCALILFAVCFPLVYLREKNANEASTLDKASSQSGAETFSQVTEPPVESSTSSLTPTEGPTFAPTTLTPTAAPTDSTNAPTKTVVRQDEPQEVVIIGAGWAGLSAMQTLQQNGVERVKILEGREYIGGRSRTDRTFVPGVPIELGSEWLYPDSSVQSMADKLQLSYGFTSSSYDTFGLYETAALRPNQSPKLTDDEKKILLDDWWAGKNGFVPFAKKNKSQHNNAQQVLDAYQGQATTPVTEEERQFLFAMSETVLTAEFGAEPDEISAAEALYDLGGGNLNHLGVAGGGYDSLISALSDPFVDRIQLQSRVTRIQYGQENGNMAVVTYVGQNGMTRTVEAGAVLVTVPLGVLKASSIDFVPALPQEKTNAINNLGFGTLNKCVMYWQDANQAWWPQSDVWLGLITASNEVETAGGWTTFFNPQTKNTEGYPILTGWVGGDEAVSMESQSDEQVMEMVLSNLRSMFGDNVPIPTKYIVSRWAQDEFSRGSYSFPLAGSGNSATHRQQLGRSVGNLYWAGEATDSEWWATTEGAYNSGARAGNDIAKLFRR